MGKETIIAQIRKNKRQAIDYSKIQKIITPAFSDKLSDFKENLLKVGAEVIEVEDKKELEMYINSKRDSVKLIDFTKYDSWELYPENCHKKTLETINIAILEGQIGVAENGAIWIDESNFSNRLIPFIAEKLIILLNSKNIVENMHQAYTYLDKISIGFGVFISGPSKTADIEQTLVYGAHGAVDIIVLLY